MTPTVLVSVLGVLAVVGIYFWWARAKSAASQPQQQQAQS
jgi:hypothetical protein